MTCLAHEEFPSRYVIGPHKREHVLDLTVSIAVGSGSKGVSDAGVNILVIHCSKSNCSVIRGL